MTEEIEIWKTIIGYDGYQVSSFGRVKSFRRNKKIGHILIECDDGRGYSIIGLLRSKKKYTKRIHQLVANAFLPNIKNRKEINHLDGNKKNNRVSNLEWSTRLENLTHAIGAGLMKYKSGENHHRSKLVLDLATGIYYGNGREAAEAKNINYMTLLHKLNGSKRNNTSMIYV